MKILTKSKRSTELATNIKKSNRWFRIGSHRGEIEYLFDLYWGGKERRITGMTLRIMGVNAIAVVALIIGVVYLGQYHATLISEKLKRFETEILLVSSTLSESEDVISEDQAERISSLIGRVSATLDTRLFVFDMDANLVADSEYSKDRDPIVRIIKDPKNEFFSVELLKNTAGFIASLLPQRERLLPFPNYDFLVSKKFPDLIEAKSKKLSISAWRNEVGEVVLTAAMPIWGHDDVKGIVMLVNDNEDIRRELGDMWFNILKIFIVTFLVTILLSIYLSGVIARPLRKLASAAERVRKGKLKYTEIPDMSDRHDEIGELSVVLRDMTHALWERMDTIEAFAADVAHEIKNPLTSLKSAVETARVVKKKEDLEKLLDVIRHDVDRLDRLITDISSASKLDAELSREAFDVVDLKDILARLIDAYRGPLERHEVLGGNENSVLKDGVVISLKLPKQGDIFVQGSEGRLFQVFQNILENALSFSKLKSKVDVVVSVKANRVTITIQDEGPGIPEGKLKDIFERFYSERPHHEEYGRHSGLGLSICKQIITAHAGVIYAENRKGRNDDITGARFVVILNML